VWIGSGVLGAVLLLVIGLLVNGANTKYDKYFGTSALRKYARPFYSEMTSCKASTLAQVTGATCTFKTGEEVNLVELKDGISVATWRSALVQAIGADNVDQGRWRGGDLWTLDADGDPGLYWDVEDDRIAGVAVLANGTDEALRSWWTNHFGR
jgi:hypothetical protein